MNLLHLTSSPHFYTFLYVAVALLAAFNIFEIFFLLRHKRRIELSEARKELLKREISTALISAAEPAETLPRPLDYTDYEAYSEAASSIIESFEGEIADRARQLVYKFSVDQYFQSRCRGLVWFKRAHAVDTLSALKLEKNREFFTGIFTEDTSKEVKYRAIYGLSLIACEKEHIYSVARFLSGMPYLTAKYTADIFFNVITALKNKSRGHEFIMFLKDILKDPGITTKIKRDCLTACHAAACENAGAVVMGYYEAFPEEPEITIACIKSLMQIGDLAILPKVLGHKDWRVRLTALKYAHLCGPAVLPALEGMLHDANYHIRVNAALALSRTGEKGRELLQAAVSGQDKFAADAANYALAEEENAS